MGAGNGDDEADGDFEPRRDRSVGLDCINQMNITTDSLRPISPLALPVRNSLYFHSPIPPFPERPCMNPVIPPDERDNHRVLIRKERNSTHVLS